MSSSGAALAQQDYTMGRLIGEENIDRRDLNTNQAMVNGATLITPFRAKRTEQITRLMVITGTTAQVAATDLWLIAYELTTADGGVTWTATVVGQSADDNTLLNAASAAFTRNTVAPFTKLQNHYYAVAALALGATTNATLAGATNLVAGVNNSGEVLAGPPIAATIAGLAGVPVGAQAIANTNKMVYGVMLP